MTDPHDPIDAALRRWHQMVAARDMRLLPELLAPDVVFRSPFVFTPYHGAAKTQALLSTVLQVFSNFRYHRSYRDAASAVLEFTADIGDRSCKGVDIISFDAAGRICEFEVLIRPASALHALSQEMGARLAQQGLAPK
jgi:hypothetical protein